MPNSAQDIQLRELRDTIKELNNLIKTLQETITSLTEERNHYKEQSEYFQKKLFGSSSERRKSYEDIPGQMNLFNEAEAESAPEEPDPDIPEEQTEKKSRKPKTTQKDKFKDLPKEKRYIDLPEDMKICPECGSALKVIGEEFVRREVEFIPAVIKIIEYYSLSYECPECSKDAEVTKIFKGRDHWVHLTHGMASPAMLAWVMYQKYFRGMPLYRQEMDWKQLTGFDLSRSTMANWIINNTEEFLKPVADYFHRVLLKSRYLMADETPVQVLHEPERKAQTKSYMWIFRTGEQEEIPIILYRYYETRAGDNAAEFLKGFGGYLMCDGYGGYNKVKGILRCSCWAHIRRYLIDAIPKGEKYNMSLPAVQGLSYIDRLFKYEEDIHAKYRNPEAIKKARMNREKPVLDAFWTWLDTQKPVRGSRFDAAVTYIRNRKEFLETYLEDGSCSFSNNATERSAKAFVTGRKNWLFSDTPEGAQSSAVIYSIVETAKANGVNIYHYLKFLLEKCPTVHTSEEEMEKLTPWNEEVKAEISRRVDAERSMQTI